MFDGVVETELPVRLQPAVSMATRAREMSPARLLLVSFIMNTPVSAKEYQIEKKKET